MENNQTENFADHNKADLLNADELMLNEFVYASTGQRFLNYLIDNIFMNYGIGFLTGYVIGLIIGVSETTYFNDIRENSMSMFVFIYTVAILNYLFYYILSEKLFNGYTLGKLITGTRAIRDDGTAMTFKDVLIRTLCRLVPFEVFSGFKIRAWHDEWSRTMVVKAR